MQITKEFHRLGKYLPEITVQTVFGGIPIKNNIESLKGGCDILIGTPGRIADLLRHKAIDVSKLKYFVVDECDLQFETIRIPYPTPLSIGCRRDIHEVFTSTPYDKQVMMFTATLPAEAKTVCLKYMQNVGFMFELLISLYVLRLMTRSLLFMVLSNMLCIYQK